MKAVKLPFAFDPERLLSAAAEIPSDLYYELTSPYFDQGDVSAVALLEPIQNLGGGRFAFGLTEIGRARSEWADVLEVFQADATCARLQNLAAGSSIRRHRDVGRCFERGEVRVHIPVATNPGVTMTVDGYSFHMKAGECWHMDLDAPHEVTNGGDEDRLHLVVDFSANEWWRSVLEEAGYAFGSADETDRMSDRDRAEMEQRLKELGYSGR